MIKSANRKSLDYIFTIAIVLIILLQTLFPQLKHNATITLEKEHTNVVKIGDEKYIAHETDGTTTINITNASVFSRGFLTDDHLNAIIAFTVEASMLCLFIALILKKPIAPIVFGIIASIIFLYSVGCIYTYCWFATNGAAFVNAGYKLVLPYNRHISTFILVGSLFYYWMKKAQPIKSITMRNYHASAREDHF